jgi:hypothetical protein
MLNHTWKIVLLIIALVFVLWDFVPGYGQWISAIALVVLVIDEFMKNTKGSSSNEQKAPAKAKPSRKKRK